MNSTRWMHPLGWSGTLIAFGAAGALSALVPRPVMPPVLAFAAIWLLRQEALDGSDIWRDRLRFRRLSSRDWRDTLIALLVIGAPMIVLRMRVAPAMELDAATALGILSQEVLWRGVVLPRQEAALGDRAWIANTVGWTVFSSPMGVAAVVTLVPMFIVVPWLVQRRRNSWIGVLLHAFGLSAGFLSLG